MDGIFFMTEKRNLTVFITKCYYLNLISIAKLMSIINFTNPIWPTGIRQHCCIIRMILHQLGLKLNMVSLRVWFCDLSFSSFLGLYEINQFL